MSRTATAKASVSYEIGERERSLELLTQIGPKLAELTALMETMPERQLKSAEDFALRLEPVALALASLAEETRSEVTSHHAMLEKAKVALSDVIIQAGRASREVERGMADNSSAIKKGLKEATEINQSSLEKVVGRMRLMYWATLMTLAISLASVGWLTFRPIPVHTASEADLSPDLQRTLANGRRIEAYALETTNNTQIQGFLNQAMRW